MPLQGTVKASDTTTQEVGIGKITLLVFGTMLAVVLYCAFNILPFFYYYYQIQSDFESAIKVAGVATDRELRYRLMQEIKHMELPVEPDDLVIIRDGHHMKISLAYQEIFYITYKDKDYDLYTFDFVAEAEGDF